MRVAIIRNVRSGHQANDVVISIERCLWICLDAWEVVDVWEVLVLDVPVGRDDDW